MKPKNQYLVHCLDGDFKTLKKLENGIFKPLVSRLKYDIDTVTISNDRKFLGYEINENGFTKLFLNKINSDGTLKSFNFISNAPKIIHQADHLKVTFNRTNSTVIISASSSQFPRIQFSYDLISKEWKQWSLKSSPEIVTEDFVSAELNYYVASDGTKIPMFVRRSKDCLKKNCPVVVHFHGGPESQSLPGFNVLGQLFVESGFVFVEPNVRGSSGYGYSWMQSDNGPKRKMVISDIKDAAEWIKKNWVIDGRSPKIGIFGGSYGGYSTFMGMTYFAGTYDAGVAIVGMSNLVSFLKNTAPYRRPVRETEYGFLDKDLDSLIELSPITHIKNIKAPLMIIQGANDPRVPVGEAIQIQKILESLNIPSELVVFPDEGHGSAKKENKILEWGYLIEFFNKHLKK